MTVPVQGLLKAYTQITSVLSCIVVPAVIPEASPSYDTDIPSRENTIPVYSRYREAEYPNI